MPLPIEVADRGRLDLQGGGWETAWLNIFTRKTTVDMPDGKAFDCRPFRKFTLLVSLTAPSFPFTRRIQVQFSGDTGAWYDYVNGPFGDLEYGGGAGAIKEAIVGDCIAEKIRVNITGSASVRAIFSS